MLYHNFETESRVDQGYKWSTKHHNLYPLDWSLAHSLILDPSHRIIFFVSPPPPIQAQSQQILPKQKSILPATRLSSIILPLVWRCTPTPFSFLFPFLPISLPRGGYFNRHHVNVHIYPFKKFNECENWYLVTYLRNIIIY